ncbi:MAG TPA: PCP reductase family protein [Nitrospiria bacterium]|nr:PCP reductase family protein [Nitrospiria bacterium]
MSISEEQDQLVVWTGEALKRLENAPIFLRGMVKKLAEKKARQEGLDTITPDHLARWKNETMGMVEAPTEAGGLFWTKKAKERLDTVPEFMRGMVKRIAEDIARQGGHLEVNTELFSRVEALGVIAQEPQGDLLPWTPGALTRLEKKVENTPPVATDFVRGMLKRDAEELALGKGYGEITEEVLTRIWDEPQEEVVWSPEAWARLQTSPDFVRSGIKKAAERRARKIKAKVVTSDLLTQFRNEAMMKAVMRIRQLGFTELTFDAFEAAKQKVKRLKGNEQAEKRLEEIRDYMTKKPHVGVLGEELMERFRKYLKGEEKKLL